ncbi:polymorphic toxin-type HINT domain-containing protein [uncultured Cytophaga sp.]|uniref:polymorphic toxin-type HINT domain-containing protein n=1 Tax=uncultured Cytophaga sp. TaxID=160238 RepID=UPI00261E5A9D|nr:polymorphic toxin-type HINT domain-containing protein [uncultured Cytophaga sp.]
MSHPKEYVTTGALMKCSQGAAPMLFKSSPRTTKIGGFKAGNEFDSIPLQNVPSFIICQKLTQMANGVPTPCTPAPTMWEDTYEAKVGGGKALLKMSCIQCTTGQGKIEFITSGQAPLPPDVVADMQSAQKEGTEALEKAQQEEDAVGEAGFVEGLIPIWGSGRDLIHAAQTGDGWGIGLNSLFLVWDAFSVVAGVVSFGAATAAMMGAKAGVRTAFKAAGKVVLSAAKKQGAELLAKSAKVFKGLGPKIADFTQGVACKLLKACFPAGTPIAAKGGYKNIEDIRVGDLVWSWDALTGDIGLKPVIAIMENESNALIKITSGSETIYATPEHPFRVGESIDGAWKNAEDLTLDDELWLLDKRNKSIFSLDLEPQDQPVKVYNFEVADWHNYFVGMWMMLVHNLSCWQKVFFKAHPLLKGKVVVHHAIERQVFDSRWPGLFDEVYKNSIENLRGIPKEINSKTHLSHIRIEWDKFYTKFEDTIPSQKNVLDYVNYIDNKYGHLFNPPIKF